VSFCEKLQIESAGIEAQELEERREKNWCVTFFQIAKAAGGKLILSFL